MGLGVGDPPGVEVAVGSGVPLPPAVTVRDGVLVGVAIALGVVVPLGVMVGLDVTVALDVAVELGVGIPVDHAIVAPGVRLTPETRSPRPQASRAANRVMTPAPVKKRRRLTLR